VGHFVVTLMTSVARMTRMTVSAVSAVSTIPVAAKATENEGRDPPTETKRQCDREDASRQAQKNLKNRSHLFHPLPTITAGTSLPLRFATLSCKHLTPAPRESRCFPTSHFVRSTHRYKNQLPCKERQTVRVLPQKAWKTSSR
jgi:hypothetical protein